MKFLDRSESFVLLLGDIFFFMVSLWLSLLIRNVALPSKALFLIHFSPFGLLFLMWVIVFYIAGLYERRTLIIRSKLPGIIFNTQVANSIIGVLFFYFIP